MGFILPTCNGLNRHNISQCVNFKRVRILLKVFEPLNTGGVFEYVRTSLIWVKVLGDQKEPAVSFHFTLDALRAATTTRISPLHHNLKSIYVFSCAVGLGAVTVRIHTAVCGMRKWVCFADEAYNRGCMSDDKPAARACGRGGALLPRSVSRRNLLSISLMPTAYRLVTLHQARGRLHKSLAF